LNEFRARSTCFSADSKTLHSSFVPLQMYNPCGSVNFSGLFKA
jgi:hypothetical protein